MTLIKEKMCLARVGTLGFCSLSFSLSFSVFLTKQNQNELMGL